MPDGFVDYSNYTDEQIAQLPPSEQAQAYRERAIAQSGGGILSVPVGVVQGTVEASAAQRREMQQLTSGDVEYVQGLQPSNTNYPGHDHATMYQQVHTVEPSQVVDQSNSYHKLHQAFQAFSDDLRREVSKSQSEWEGDAADSAHGYFKSLGDWSDGNAQNARLASETLYEQSQSAETAKNSMPEEVPFSWETEMARWGSDPFNITANVAESIATYQRSNEAHAEAARVMTDYDNNLYTAASKQPAFAEPPKFSTGSGTGRDGFSDGGQIHVPPGGTTNPSGYTGGGVPGGSSVPTSASSVGSVPGVSSPSGAGTTTPQGYTAAPISSTTTGTPPSSAQFPSGRRPSTSNVSGYGAVPMGPMGGAGGFGPGGSGGGGGAAGGGYGRGVGGFGPGGGAGSGAAAGRGPMSGMAPGAGAAAGAAGAAGSSGAGTRAGGMAGGMGGGRGGQGGEDEEHQRPTYLVEADPDSIFGTDERTAPPVIGE